jgi:sugar transferase (PEP-CTERM system associated)
MSTPVFTLIMGDVLNALFAFYIAFSLRFGEIPITHRFFGADGTRLLIFVVVLLFVSFLLELYDLEKNLGKRDIFARLPMVLAISFFILSALYYSMPVLFMGRGLLFIAIALFILLQLLWHIIHKSGFDRLKYSNKVLILGTGELACQIGKLISSSNSSYALAGYLGNQSEPATVSSDSIIGPARKVLETAETEKAQKIVVSVSERRGGLPLQELLECKFSGIDIVDAPSFYEQLTGKILLENITGGWFVFSKGFKRTLFLRLFKKIGDKVIAVTMLVAALPIIFLIALLIRISSPGPVLFRQVRVGEREKRFVLYKFRTMRTDAEDSTGAVWAQKNDPRVTALGGFLRKTRLDEIPQLYNVLKGDMCFIGPRPERPEFIEQLKQIIPFYSERHFVKPGLTGWAQVKYSYGASIDDAIEKLRYDLYYIKNMSVHLDILILLETVKVVLFGRGGR